MNRNAVRKLKAVFVLSFALTFAFSPIFFEGERLINFVQAQEAPDSLTEESEVSEQTQEEEVDEDLVEEPAGQEETGDSSQEAEVEESTTPGVEEEVLETPEEDKSDTSDKLTKVNDSTYFTTEPVVTGTTYVFPKNNKVTITFTELPSESARLSIREIKLSKEEVEAVGALSDTAYEFETTMQNGTFKYNLTLPNPSNKSVQVKYSEERSNLESALDVEIIEKLSNGVVTLNGLDHFTVFVVVANPTAPPANTQEGLIDNGDAEFSTSGSGINLSGSPCSDSGYLLDAHYGAPGSTALFTWTFDDIPQSGNYVVQAHWIGHSNRTNAAPYTINDENGATVVVVNQKTGVATCSSSGFQTLGTFEFNESGTYTVTLPAVASGYVSADAVKLVFVENQPTVTAVNTVVADATYVGGQDIDLTVEFSEEVNITGSPRILLNSGAYANYLSGSGTNTLTFRYTVGADEESTDLDYSATNSLELNGGTIQDISTNDADLTLPAVGTFAGVHAIVIDAKAPAVPSLVSPTDGTYTTTAGLTSIDWTDEADMSGPVIYYYQSAFDATVGAENALTSPIYTSGVLGTSVIPTGGTGAGVYYYQFRSCDAVGNCSDWSGPFVVTVDNTAPVLTVNNDVEVGPVAIDTVNVSVTETNPDAATFEYGFSADAVCDATDTFGNAFVDGVEFAITDETNNGNYICLKASDLSGNTTYQLSANVLNVDATDPTIGAVSVVTDFDPFVRGNGTGFQIRMNALDLNGIATCEYSLDNGATWTAGFYNAAPAVDRCQANNVTAPDTQVLTITMRATDTLGNESIGTAIVRTADSANPVVTAFTVNPSIGGFTTANPVLDFTITDNLSDINRCQYRYRITGSGAAGWSAWTNGSLIGTGTSVSCLETITGLTDGVSYDFQVRGRDGVNHNSAVSSINGLIVDANMTSTVFTSPANGTFWNTAIDLDGISTDSVGVDYVELYYSDDNGATWNLIDTLDNAANDTPFNWSYDWTPAAEGEYDLRAIGYDTVGNTSTADAFDVTYDITAPAIPNPISPVDGYKTQGVAFTQTWDTIADATLYRYQSCHVNPGDAGAACSSVRYTNTYVSPSKFVGAGQPNGQFWWRVQAQDAAGNWSAFGESYEMIIDNSDPVVTLNAYTPDPTSNITLNYTGTAADVYLAGIESVEYRVEDSVGNVIVDWTNANATDGTFDSVNENFNFSFGVTYDDTYTVYARATDFAGNVSFVVSDEITVDTTKPVVVDELTAAIFNEGDSVPLIETNVTDTLALDKLCYTITHLPSGSNPNTFDPSTSFSGCEVLTGTADTVDLETILSSAIVAGFTDFDSSWMNEGDYVINYHVIDTAGNKSDSDAVTLGDQDYVVTYTLENVAPTVTLSNDQTIEETETATFDASFIDPSYFDIGGSLINDATDSDDDIHDDANWTVTVDYGDGSGVTSLGTMNEPGDIEVILGSIEHIYGAVSTDTEYTVTLEVCENSTSPGEGECNSAQVKVMVLNNAPIVSISTNPGDSTTLQAITMLANASVGNSPYTYSWGNGNFAGCTGTGASVTTPSTPGSYTCEVTVTDVDGDTATAIKTVVVNPNPIVDASPTVIIIANSPATGGTGTVNVAAGTNFTLSAVTSSGNASFDYVFSGTCSGNTNNTGTTFSTNVMNLAAGTYTCFVTVTDNDGDTASASVPIVVSGGVGAGGVLGDNTDNEDNDNDEDSEEDEEGSVLGAQTCEETETLTGTVYLDVNENGTQDSDEDGLSGITVSVYYTDEDGERKFLRSIDTDSEGKYEFELCAGEYEIEVSRNDLESGNVLSENVQDVTLTLDTDVEGIDFEVVESDDTAESADSEDNEFNWLYVIIPVIVLLVLLLLYLASRNRGSKGQDVDFV